MDRERLRAILEDLAAGRTSVEAVVGHLRDLPYADLGFARVDTHRSLRNGAPEAVFCQGKTPDQVVAIVRRLAMHHANVLATRAEPVVAEALAAAGVPHRYHAEARVAVVRPEPTAEVGLVAVVSAGTADQPVAEEAAVTAEALGNRVERAWDCGVAGLHRLLDQHHLLSEANVIVVVAGMEGALPSVVGGLVDRPVIAVPTSVGYGTAFGGITALLAMLNSCAAGVSVVNIDNGYGAACQASRINHLVHKIR
jgi:pyridinium-3,5-biscarboxylic acid mononucleotide synthase